MMAKMTENSNGQPGSDRVAQALEKLARSSDSYASSGKADSTKRAYLSDWQDFVAWANWRRFTPFPAQPSTVALYLTALANDGKRPSTIERRRAAIAYSHKQQGQPSPTHDPQVEEVMAGIRRHFGVAQQGKKAAVTEDILAMIATLTGDLRGVRDRALLLIGFAGAFRRSELIALDVEDVEIRTDGLVVNIRRSKTDQGGKGRVLGIPYGSRSESCPVSAYQDWLHASGISSGALFRGVSTQGKLLTRLSDKGVARAVKRAAEKAGLDSACYSGHSLRAGLATSAASGGAYDRDIMRQTGHKRVETLHRYIRKEELFQDNVVKRTGL